MTFNESNTVEAFIRDRLAGSTGSSTVAPPPGLARQGGAISGLGWHFVGPADLPRQSQKALVEPYLRDALIRLNPDIAANPSRVDDVLYRLRAIVMSARSDGLVKANVEFAAWMLGERSMPFGAEPPSLFMPMRQLQSLFAPLDIVLGPMADKVSSFNLLMINPPALHAQQSGHLAVPIPPVLFGQPDHRQAQGIFILRFGLIP